MYGYIASVTCLSTVKPYVRKNFTDCLDCYDYLYINTFIIATFVLLLMMYALFFDEDKSVTKSINKYKNPFIHGAYLNIISIIFLLIASYISVEREINIYHIFGIIAIVIGVCLLNVN